MKNKQHDKKYYKMIILTVSTQHKQSHLEEYYTTNTTFFQAIKNLNANQNLKMQIIPEIRKQNFISQTSHLSCNVCHVQPHRRSAVGQCSKRFPATKSRLEGTIKYRSRQVGQVGRYLGCHTSFPAFREKQRLLNKLITQRASSTHSFNEVWRASVLWIRRVPVGVIMSGVYIRSCLPSSL